MFLADLDQVVGGGSGDGHVEPGAGTDHDVGVGGGQVFGQAVVAEPAVLGGAGVLGRKQFGWQFGPFRPLVQREGAAFGVGGRFLAQVHQGAQPHLRWKRQDRFGPVLEDRDDLDLVSCGQGRCLVGDRADGTADAVHVVDQVADLHPAPEWLDRGERTRTVHEPPLCSVWE